MTSTSEEKQMIGGDASSELSSNRTAMSFQRTEMSSDRTLMSIIRTSLSLIGFGFTIYQFFRTLQGELNPDRVPSEAPTRLGLTLIGLGVLILILGIWNHWNAIKSLRERRERLYRLHLIHHLPQFRISSVSAIAVALLVTGLLAIIKMAFGLGPF